MEESSGRAQASFFRRACALFLDLFILQILYLLLCALGVVALMLGLSSVNGANPSEVLLHSFSISAVSLWFLLFFVYFTYFCVMGGQTPAKTLFRLRIISLTGEITLGQALIRTGGYLLSFFLCGGGFLLAILPQRRALHDLIAGTEVVDI